MKGQQWALQLDSRTSGFDSDNVFVSTRSLASRNRAGMMPVRVSSLDRIILNHFVAE